MFPDQRLFIDGAFSPSVAEDPAFFTSTNPATNTPLARIYEASPRDLQYALDAATKAFESWSKTTPIERSRILNKAVSILRGRNHEIARVESLDTGKPFSETSTVDVPTGADVLEYFAGVCLSGLEGKMVRLREKAWVYTTKEPLGVCVGIGAWNYPIQIALWKCAPALAAGNTFIFKPSEVTPLTANILAEVFTAAGLPSGVFNVVHGSGRVGAWLSSCSGVAKISFTGQVETGKKVYASAAGSSLKNVTLELGGKSPFIVLPGADLGLAADAAMVANFYSCGQVCTNGTRVFVHSSIKSKFEDLLLERARDGIRAGDPLDPNVNFGPLVSEGHAGKVKGYIRHGEEVDKARLLCGGSKQAVSLPDGKGLEGGFFVAPTIFTDCDDSMLICREEIFGPVLCILTYETEEEVVRRANDTELGLAAGVFTKDIDAAHRVIGKMNAGICWINTWGESPAEMPAGGWGLSGVGFENGSEALSQFVRTRCVLVENGGFPAVFSKS
ncbi:aldehyde dehydrogenase [Tuber magnatum]|uniref:aldehyde dehydrogenase (NAD(+)) n=1 Tax=Tuber magnatum TaxID=42249 RepID=A0A317SSU3_9PEZI|nr:aldehyde dehydrogenase [Tuber magnatum]